MLYTKKMLRSNFSNTNSRYCFWRISRSPILYLAWVPRLFCAALNKRKLSLSDHFSYFRDVRSAPLDLPISQSLVLSVCVSSSVNISQLWGTWFAFDHYLSNHPGQALAPLRNCAMPIILWDSLFKDPHLRPFFLSKCPHILPIIMQGPALS